MLHFLKPGATGVVPQTVIDEDGDVAVQLVLEDEILTVLWITRSGVVVRAEITADEAERFGLQLEIEDGSDAYVTVVP